MSRTVDSNLCLTITQSNGVFSRLIQAIQRSNLLCTRHCIHQHKKHLQEYEGEVDTILR